MNLTATIFAVLITLQPWSGDRHEDPVAREARLLDVAAAVSAAVQHARCEGAWSNVETCRVVWGGDPLELAAAMLALGWHETHWASAVQAGRCSDLGPRACDRGRARGPWQAWQRACPALHAAEPGSDAALRAGAWCAVWLLSGAARVCTDRGQAFNWSGAFSRYGGGPCLTNRAEPVKRVRTMRRLYAELRTAVPK